MSDPSFDLARYNMVEQQIRTWEVLDERVLDVLAQTPREDFVPEHHRRLAFADAHIPLDHGQVMMQPKQEGRLLQALEIRPTDSILEVGTGSGYLTACLARLGRHVYSVDIFPEFKYAAQAKLAAHGIENVSLRVGDASTGWSLQAPYDVVAVTGSVPLLPPGFENDLAIGGRLFIVVGEPPVMEALLITRTGENEWVRESLFETVLPPLINAPRPQRFVL
jgi:protein-L-isoaspartate(D-aspartate) O-methyltransferase